MPTNGTLESKCEVVDVIDKGSGAVILIDSKLFFKKNIIIIIYICL